jgi:site-specific DNA recombinase
VVGAVARSSVRPPRSAYVREDRITTHIDTWLARLFDPNHIEHTIAELTQPFADDPVPPRAEVLRRTIAQLDQKLGRYREALEAGTNPALIATWTAEVESARAAAETELAGLGPASPRPIENIPALIDIRQEWGTMAEALGAADGTRKGDLLSNLGVLVSYDPLTRRARVTCRPKVSESVVSEGGLQPDSLGFVPVHRVVSKAEPPGSCGDHHAR